MVRLVGTVTLLVCNARAVLLAPANRSSPEFFFMAAVGVYSLAFSSLSRIFSNNCRFFKFYRPLVYASASLASSPTYLKWLDVVRCDPEEL